MNSDRFLVLVLLALAVAFALWRIESKLGKILAELLHMSKSLDSIEQRADEIGDSASSVAVNIATRK
jgi:hypothetical protein